MSHIDLQSLSKIIRRAVVDYYDSRHLVIVQQFLHHLAKKMPPTTVRYQDCCDLQHSRNLEESRGVDVDVSRIHRNVIALTRPTHVDFALDLGGASSLATQANTGPVHGDSRHVMKNGETGA